MLRNIVGKGEKGKNTTCSGFIREHLNGSISRYIFSHLERSL
ncbi:MAG: hypothetical protein R6U96_08035 [Promethearchaeia archaeon]